MSLVYANEEEGHITVKLCLERTVVTTDCCASISILQVSSMKTITFHAEEENRDSKWTGVRRLFHTKQVTEEEKITSFFERIKDWAHVG